jgi:hypothetical protein
MKLLITIALVLFVHLPDAQAQNLGTLKWDNRYFVRAVCGKGSIFLHLLKGKKKIFVLDTKNICESYIYMDDNFTEPGRKIIQIYPQKGIMPTTGVGLYYVDKDKYQIIWAGSMPISAESQENGTYLYETIGGYSKIKVIYAFLGKKFIEKKATRLTYNSKVCIKKMESGSSIVYEDCEDGIEGTPENPICSERLYGKEPEIIPLDKCDIKKGEVYDIRE